MSLEQLEVTKCPRCGATCIVGNDVDMQQFCAKCYNSFKIKNTFKVPFTDMTNAKERYSHVGWDAFVPREK